MQTLKEQCHNYNYVSNFNRDDDKLKFLKILYELNYFERFKCIEIMLGENVKETFYDLHIIKMAKHYNYIYFYHMNIEKRNYNEKLLCFLETILKRTFLKGVIFYLKTKWLI